MQNMTETYHKIFIA